MVTYDEFVQSISDYMNSSMGIADRLLTIFLIVGSIVFIVWFTFYLKKEYKRKKAKTDTFDTTFGKDLKYPGFHPGGAPKSENKEKKDPGGINDEY